MNVLAPAAFDDALDGCTLRTVGGRHALTLSARLGRVRIGR